MISTLNWTKILVYSSALQCKKVQFSIEKFHWSKKWQKPEIFSFNLNIRVPFESVNLFLHVFFCVLRSFWQWNTTLSYSRFHLKIGNILVLITCPEKFGTTCPSVIFWLATGSRPRCLRYLCCWLAHVFSKRTPFKIIWQFIALKNALNVYFVKTESNILLGVEDNVKLDLWSRQLMPSQSTERKKNWHSQTRLVCDRCCALVNSFINRAIVPTCS